MILSPFLAIVIIYLAGLIVFRRKMASFRDTAIQLIIAWWLLLGAMVAVPEIFLYSRMVILIIAGISFMITGYLYYRYSKPKQCKPFKPVKEVSPIWTITRRIILLSGQVFETFVAITLPLLTWEWFVVLTTTGDYVPVVTYGNVIMGILFVAGLYLLRDLIIRYRKYREQKKANN